METMSDNQVTICYKIYLEAEDVAQSRILSSASYLKNVLCRHKNPYINRAEIDNESDLDDFVLRLYAEESIDEECENADAAEAFLDEFAEILSELAHAHSFMDMEGSFSISFEGEQIAYRFCSKPGQGTCTFTEVTEK